MKRNGEEYLDNWIPFASAGDFIVVVPEFSRRYFPKDADYSLGRVLGEHDSKKWAFSVPDHLFDYLKTRLKLRADKYRVFGHSAGAQFVHRWLLFRPSNRADIIIAANPGWYTMPEWDPKKTTFSFPYSLVGSPIEQQQIREAFARQFILMLGEHDTDPQHKHLNRSPGAMAQGLHRFARGQTFFATARDIARRINSAFAWKLVVVLGSGHDSAAMARFAVNYTYGQAS
jgi:pimeloyl-ACP methyl ester carboxylesterase